jgi:hypothetical protein
MAGFTADHGGKLVAAIGELYSNVVEHSQRIDSGYVAYSGNNGRFEFVVGDSGIGVLKSLTSNPTFANIADFGRALELVLSDGVSRHDQDDGHGHGFRPLFVGLANLSKSIRFHSGDHSREIVRNDDGSLSSRTRQISTLDGFFCSVLCEVSS